MKHLLLFCLACLFFVSSVQAQCTWQTVGTGAASTATTSTAYTRLAFNSTGVPYVIYTDGATTNTPVVRKYSGSAWTTVGSGLGANSAYTSIVIDGSDVPNIILNDGSQLGKARVMKYNGTSWVSVGTGTLTTDSALYCSITASGNDLYVVYSDKANGKKAYAKKYDSGSNTWSTLGTAISTGTANYTSIAVDASAVPYVAYLDAANSNKATVKKFNGTAWVAVGTGTVSTGAAQYPSIAINAAGTPYVAYIDVTPSYVGNIKSFNGTSWQAVGTGTISNVYTSFSLALDQASTPYVTYYDLGMYKASVMKYNGTSWAYAGNSYFSTGTPAYNHIAIKQDGTPYVTFYSGGTYVYELGSPLTASAVATQTMCSNTTATIAVVTNTATGVTYQWQQNPGTGVFQDLTNTFTYTNVTTANLNVNYPSASTSGYGYRCIVSNGCVNRVSNAQVLTVNPQPSLMLNSTTTCLGTAVTLTVTGASTYTWSTGENGASISVNPLTATTYTVTGSTLGCVATTTAIVGVNPVPTISITSNAPICEGSMLNLSATGTPTDTYVWQGPNSYSTSLQSPAISMAPVSASGDYTLTATNSYSCSTTATLNAQVNPVPSLTLTSNVPSICSGSSATLQASGASVYSWTPAGNTTSAIVVSPTVSTTYSVTGISLGCTSQATINLPVGSSKVLSGTVSSPGGPVSGDMMLYRYSPVLSQWDLVTFTPFSSIFSFGALDSSDYVLKAVPTATNMQITYASSAISWQGATVLHHGCLNNTTEHVTIEPYTALTQTGSGSLSGQITEGLGYGQKPSGVTAPGNPIGGIVVKGGKNPGGSIFMTTTTDASGNYTISALPANAAGEEYFILVDIPGLDTNNTYHRVITIGANQFTGLDFVVDSAMVNPIASITGIHAQSSLVQNLQVFPNPAHNESYLSYDLISPSSVRIELFDMLGRSAGLVLPATQQSSGRQQQQLPLEKLEAEVYFIALRIDQKDHILKLVISR